jgi:acyl carrier protein
MKVQQHKDGQVNMNTTAISASQLNEIKITNREQEIQRWLIAHISQLMEISIEEVNPLTSFDSYGLDSASAVAMISDLEDWLQIEIDPTLVYEYPTINELAHRVIKSVTQ